MKRWVHHEWRSWLVGHPWTMLYVLTVTTAGFIIDLIEAIK